MTRIVTVDDKRRVRIADAEPGQRVQVQSSAEGWKVSPVKPPEETEAFPRGSLLKYITAEYNREQLEILKGCVLGPGPDEPNE